MDRVIALFLGLRNPISHEPVLSEDIKTALKTQLFPRHVVRTGPPQSDRGKDRWISHGGLQMRVKNTVKDVGVADSQDKETGCAFQLPKTT